MRSKVSNRTRCCGGEKRSGWRPAAAWDASYLAEGGHTSKQIRIGNFSTGMCVPAGEVIASDAFQALSPMAYGYLTTASA